jgi:hypothetical protein
MAVVFKDIEQANNLLIKVSVQSKADEFTLQLMTGRSTIYKTEDVIWTVSLPHMHFSDVYIIRVVSGHVYVSRQSDGRTIYDKGGLETITGMRVSGPGSNMLLLCGNSECGNDWDEKPSNAWVWITIAATIILTSLLGTGIYFYKKRVDNRTLKPL